MRMNSHSKRRALALGMIMVLAGACGGSDDGAAANKAEWEEKHGNAVSITSDDLDRSVQALNAGQRPVVLSTCTQLDEGLVESRKALPVPDPAVDAALRSALDATGTAAKTCIEGGRVASDASKIEQAQREMKTARERYDEAQSAIEGWQ